MRPFQANFYSFGNMKNLWDWSQYVWGMFQHWYLFLAKSRITGNAVWKGVLSWCKIHLSEQGFGVFNKYAAIEHFKTWRHST